MLAESDSGEVSLSGLADGCLLCPRMAGKGSSGLSSSTYKDTKLLMGAPALMTSNITNRFPKGPISRYHRIGD